MNIPPLIPIYLTGFISLSMLALQEAAADPGLTYPVIDTSQQLYFDELEPIDAPKKDEALFGQDAHYEGIAPAYHDNGDGTVTDLRTNLMWSKETSARKYTAEEAEAVVIDSNLGGYGDWRIPTIKELYSLIDFRGATGIAHRGDSGSAPENSIPFINTDFFGFRYGDTVSGERFIDAQWISATRSVSPIMGDLDGVFGVNFADGRIKCYPIRDPHRGDKKFYLRLVRGNTHYGENQFEDTGGGTILDHATGLTWTKIDSQVGMNWEEALKFAETLDYGGKTDWRLPSAKELQSIIDYSRSPDATASPAIDPIFEISAITNEDGEVDYPYLWTSTTHVDGPNASQAVYFALGRALGQMHGQIMDVHGAGAQRSDPKVGQARLGHGPQSDAQRVSNYALCVRGGGSIRDQPSVDDPLSGYSYPTLVQLEDRSYYPSEMVYSEFPPHGLESGDQFGRHRPSHPHPQNHPTPPPRHVHF